MIFLDIKFRLLNYHHYKRCYLLFFLTLVSFFIANAQEINPKRCGTKSLTPSLIDLSKFDKSNFRSDEDIIIPVVVHIVWFSEEENITDDQVLSQIDVLNYDFNALNEDISNVSNQFRSLIGRTNIHFCLANTDPNGNPTNGITRTQTFEPFIGSNKTNDNRTKIHYTAFGGENAWDVQKYLNIWVGKMNGILGKSSRPQLITFQEEDGIIIDSYHFGALKNVKAPYHLGRTCTHEVGHYFGLEHIWGTTVNDCEDDDGILDTPHQENPYFGCPVEAQYTCNDRNLVHNYMDYVDDDCMYFFTKGQVEYMQTILHNLRPTLLLNNQSNCISNVQQPFRSEYISIVPNLSEGNFNLHIDENIGQNINFSIINTTGKIVTKLLIKDTPTVHLFSLENLPPGIYFLVSNGLKANFAKKLVKI